MKIFLLSALFYSFRLNVYVRFVVTSEGMDLPKT